MVKKKAKPTIEEEIVALAKKLHPRCVRAKVTKRKRRGVSPSDIDQDFRYERVLIVHESGNVQEYKADSFPLLKAKLKRRLLTKSKGKGISNG
jgi:hypothetical protein